MYIFWKSLLNVCVNCTDGTYNNKFCYIIYPLSFSYIIKWVGCVLIITSSSRMFQFRR